MEKKHASPELGSNWNPMVDVFCEMITLPGGKAVNCLTMSWELCLGSSGDARRTVKRGEPTRAMAIALNIVIDEEVTCTEEKR